MGIQKILTATFVSTVGLMLTINPAEASFCEGAVFTPKDAAQKLTLLNATLVRQDFDRLKRASGELEAILPCMKTPAPPQVFAQAYRYIGLGHYYRGDGDTAARWFRTALELSPNHQWGIKEVEMGSELFNLYEQQRDVSGQEATLVEGLQLRAPEGTTFFLDGRPIKEAKATTDRPHILFIASSSDRHIISRYLVDGNQFPQQFLAPLEAPKKKKSKEVEVAEEDLFAVQKVRRVRPKSKTPLLLSSVATMAVAGGIYGYTFTTNQQFYEARDLATKDGLRTTNNSLVVTSLAIGVAGLGVGYAGVIVHANPIIPWSF